MTTSDNITGHHLICLSCLSKDKELRNRTDTITTIGEWKKWAHSSNPEIAHLYTKVGCVVCGDTQDLTRMVILDQLEAK